MKPRPFSKSISLLMSFILLLWSVVYSRTWSISSTFCVKTCSLTIMCLNSRSNMRYVLIVKEYWEKETKEKDKTKFYIFCLFINWYNVYNRSRRSYHVCLHVFSLTRPLILLMKPWFTMVLLMNLTLVMLMASVWLISKTGKCYFFKISSIFF